MEPEGKRIIFMRKLMVALGITIFFTLLSIFPSIGYFGEARTSVLAGDRYGFLTVCAYPNITFNPFLYPFTWLTENGRPSNSFLFISKPNYYVTGESAHPIPRTPEDLEEEAILTAVVRQLYINIPFNFFMLLVIGLVEIQDLYLCLWIGALGFPVLGVLGAFLGFFATLLLTIVVTRRLRIERGILVEIWDFLIERYLPE